MLGGDLGAFSVFEILEVLGFLKRSGVLALIPDHGERAECRLDEGQIVSARYRHRSGAEALLSVLDWRRGSFELTPDREPSEPNARPFSVASVMLEAMRLDDELERRREHLPPPEEKLFLAGDKGCPDAVGCGLSELLAEIGARPGITRSELEADSSLCPARVRLGLTQLAFCRLLAPPKPGPNFGAGEPAPESVVLAACHRVLVALDPGELSREVPALLSELGRSFGAPAVTSSSPGQGPAFARFRPASGNVLSVSFLGISREHRLLFDSFAGSVDLVLMNPEGTDEARRWFAERPERATFLPIASPREVTPGILAQLSAATNL